jgi:transcription antitermination factor NusG
MVVGQKVKIKSGHFEGLEGTLMRKNKSLRFILSFHLINQHAAIEIDAENLEVIQ